MGERKYNTRGRRELEEERALMAMDQAVREVVRTGAGLRHAIGCIKTGRLEDALAILEDLEQRVRLPRPRGVPD